MDKILEYDEELEEDPYPYEYNVPLSGEMMSPNMRSESNEDIEAEDIHNDGREGTTPASESFQDGESRWTGESYRQSIRSSQQSDATPRFHNRGNGRAANGLPSIPFQDHVSPRSLKRDHSQTSLSTHMSRNNNSVSFHLERDEYDSISEPSLPHHSISLPLTPTSNAASSYNGRTPDGSRRAVRQIGMDGGVKTLSLTDENHESVASTMHSTATSYHSRSHEDKRKSYFTLTQENFPSTDDLDDARATGSTRSMMSERYPTTPSKDQDGASSDDEDKMYDPVVICGFVLPVFLGTLIRGIPSLNRISLFLVNILPCFWCCGNTSQGRSSTDRAVLTRLNIICVILTLVQLAMAMWLFIVLLVLDRDPGILGSFAPHLWNLNGAVLSIGILAIILMITCTCTVRVVREVDLVGAIRYLWVLLWILPFETFFTISLYDYHNVTQVWIHHWWLQPQMSWFRARFCPVGTEFTKCLVPIMGEPEFDTENDWCLANYNSTDCSEIRDSAESNMESSMLRFYTALAVWSSAVLCVIMLIVNSLERIITRPIVQKSRESNVPAWLLLPSFTNMLVGGVLLFSQSSLLNSSSGSENSWIGIVYLVTGGLFLVALVMGWYLSAYTIKNHADKQSKNVAVIIMITMMAANVVMLLAIFVASIIFSANLIHSPLDQSQRGEVACRVDRNVTCTACDSLDAASQCPEWSLQEVTTILQTQLKQSASLASIFVLYAISVFRFGVTLRRHLSLYQIDYV